MRKSLTLFVSVIAIVACLSQLWHREPEFLLEDGAPGVGETIVLGNRAAWLVVESSVAENRTLEGRRLKLVGDWVGHFDEDLEKAKRKPRGQITKGILFLGYRLRVMGHSRIRPTIGYLGFRLDFWLLGQGRGNCHLLGLRQ